MLSSVLPCFPHCPTEGLYLGGGTAEDGNARARADYPGARTEWARHQAAPGLTVSATTGDSGSLENAIWSRSSALRKHPRGVGFLSGGSLKSSITRSRRFYSKLLLSINWFPEHGPSMGQLRVTSENNPIETEYLKGGKQQSNSTPEDCSLFGALCVLNMFIGVDEENIYEKCDICLQIPQGSLAGRAPWLECWPVHQKVRGSISGQRHVSGLQV